MKYVDLISFRKIGSDFLLSNKKMMICLINIVKKITP